MSLLDHKSWVWTGFKWSAGVRWCAQSGQAAAQRAHDPPGTTPKMAVKGFDSSKTSGRHQWEFPPLTGRIKLLPKRDYYYRPRESPWTLPSVHLHLGWSNNHMEILTSNGKTTFIAFKPTQPLGSLRQATLNKWATLQHKNHLRLSHPIILIHT